MIEGINQHSTAEPVGVCSPLNSPYLFIQLGVGRYYKEEVSFFPSTMSLATSVDQESSMLTRRLMHHMF